MYVGTFCAKLTPHTTENNCGCVGTVIYFFSRRVFCEDVTYVQLVLSWGPGLWFVCAALLLEGVFVQIHHHRAGKKWSRAG